MTRTRAPWRSRINWRVFAIVCSCLAVMLGTVGNLEAGYRVYPGGTGTTQPKRTVVLTAAGAIVSPASGNADQRRTDLASSFSYYSLNFDDTTPEKADWQFVVPSSYTRTTIDVTIYWTAASNSTATNQEVLWSVATTSRASGANWEAALPAAVNCPLTTSNGTAGYVNTTTVTGLTSNWAVDQPTIFEIKRVASDATDDLAGDAKILQVKIEWTASAESD